MELSDAQAADPESMGFFYIDGKKARPPFHGKDGLFDRPDGTAGRFHPALFCNGIGDYFAGTTAPLKVSLMNFLISSLFSTSTSALMSSRFSSPLRTATMFA